jgi:hypothetical protein
MNEFVTWAQLATYGGCLAAVILITELTKTLPLIGRVPTQIWSYVVALAVLNAAYYFTGQWTAAAAALTLVNAAIVSLAANGGKAAINRLTGGCDG